MAGNIGGEKLENRQEQIHSKGFVIGRPLQHGGPGDSEQPLDYNRIKVGVKTLEDAIYNLGEMVKTNNRNITSKQEILRALEEADVEKLRIISNHFYRVSGIYQTVCHYFAFMYRYDWHLIPEVLKDNLNAETVLKDFNKMMNYLDGTHIKQMCGELALEVIKSGAYYGYCVDCDDKIVLQQLPINYCRSRYKIGTNPAVEFNMKYFDDQFKDINYRMRVINLFPKEFAKGYMLFKQGKLVADSQGDTGGWYLLDPEKTVKFSFYNQLDIPYFVNAIPAILDLDAAQDLDRRKQMQKLLKILVQKLPRDKNGDLIFDVEEAQDLHNNAVTMLKRAVGVDVLTTFADVESLDMSDKNTTTTTDDLAKVERTLYNSLGISQNLFNTDGNLALDKSVKQDESAVRNLILQFEIFFEKMANNHNSQKKKYRYQFEMLETTQFNYQEMAKMYKEQTQIGFSQMLPQIALGHNQSAILNTAYFEKEILKLYEIMIPPLMSSTMSSEDVLGKKNNSNSSNTQNKVDTEDKQVGRTEKPDEEKSEKTLANIESGRE